MRGPRFVRTKPMPKRRGAAEAGAAGEDAETCEDGDGVQPGRPRFKGTAAEWADLMAPVAQKRSWLRYDETKKCSAAATLPKLIGEQHAVLEKLHEGGLIYKRSVVKDGVKLLAERMDFKLKESEAEDYYETMTRRVMNICRAVSQGVSKSKNSNTKPPWVAALPWLRVPAAASQSNDAGATTTCYIVGWDPSVQLAWRVPASTPEGRKEPSMRPTADKSRPKDPIVVRWADGYEHEISELTNEMLLEARCGEKKKEPTDVFWAGEDPSTHHALVVKLRKDGPHPLLMSLYEQGRQLDNIQVRLFDQNYEATEGAKVKAGKFMHGVAEAILAGKVDKKDLKQYRRAKCNEENIQWRLGCMKKPAAAPSSSAAKRPAKAEPPADDEDVVSEETEGVPVNSEEAVSEGSPDDGDGASTEELIAPMKRPAAMPKSKKGAMLLDGPGRSFMDGVSESSPSD